MSLLPGAVSLGDEGADRRAQLLAHQLPRIHRLPVTAEARPRTYQAWTSPERVSPPEDTDQPELWQRAVDRAGGASATHSLTASRDRTPARTAQAASATSVTRRCRTPRGSRGTGTCARRSSRSGRSLPHTSGCGLSRSKAGDPDRRGRGSTRLPVRAPSRCCRWGAALLRCRTIRFISAALFEMHDEWIALPRHHLPEGDMGDIYRKLSFRSSVLPNAPKCNRQLIPNTMTRDTTRRMRVPDRVALASTSSRVGHQRPFTQRLLGS